MECLKIPSTFQGTGHTVMNTKGKVPEALQCLTSSKTKKKRKKEKRKIPDRNMLFEEVKS